MTPKIIAALAIAASAFGLGIWLLVDTWLIVRRHERRMKEFHRSTGRKP